MSGNAYYYVVTLTQDELLYCMGCLNTYSGVPFVSTVKPSLSAANLADIQYIFDKFASLRNVNYLKDYSTAIAIQLTAAEREWLHVVIASCIVEYDNCNMDVIIHLNSDALDKVRDVLLKIQT